VVAVTACFALAAFSPPFLLSARSATEGASQPAADDSAADALRTLLATSSWHPEKGVLDWSTLRKFYSARGNQPAWQSQDDVQAALDIIEHADREGLTPEDYLAADIAPPATSDPVSQAHFDLLLTNSLLRYAHDVCEGRVSPQELFQDAALPAPHYDSIAELNSALANGTLRDFLGSLPPPADEYRSLRDLLARYRQIAAGGGWPGVTDKTRPRKIARRLAIENGGAAAGTNRNSSGVKQAISDFQQRHGLDSTGHLNARTIAEMNVDAATRVRQIELNMERWRWLPRQWESRYVVVNVPSAILTVFDNNQAVLSSRVVVGRQSDPTPILRAEAVALTVNPSWQIPTSIARREILPKANAHPSYLRRHHIVYAGGGSHLRQLPGPDNPLGAIKIEMTNRFDVYLHDTPSQSAFERGERDESHGCMRVEQILPLASYALSGSTGSAVADLENLIASGQTQKLSLPAPLPVYVVYWTVSANGDGSAQFSPDVYGRDAQMDVGMQKLIGASRMSML
jgi:murein L,D-transpeptidase YcbB/YkuD